MKGQQYNDRVFGTIQDLVFNFHMVPIIRVWIFLEVMTSLSQSIPIKLPSNTDENTREGGYSLRELQSEWTLWKTEHNLEYDSFEEELKRFKVWMDNFEYIEEHNRHRAVFGYSLGMNLFGDKVRHIYKLGGVSLGGFGTKVLPLSSSPQTLDQLLTSLAPLPKVTPPIKLG